MAYTRINWQDGESGGTPLSAENLNKMDEGIYNSSAEVGSNENGYYIKYQNGVLIQWGTVTKNVAITNSSSSTNWYYDDGYIINLPIPFVDTNYFNDVKCNNTGLITLNVYSISGQTASKFEFNLSSNISYSANNYGFRWFAIGKWK